MYVVGLLHCQLTSVLVNSTEMEAKEKEKKCGIWKVQGEGGSCSLYG